MKVKIQQFNKKNLSEAVTLFIEDYSTADFRYSEEDALNWLNSDLDSNPELCLEAVDETGSFLGAQFCYINPHSTAKSLRLDTIHVKPEYREQGIGKVLISEAIRIGKENGCRFVSLMADGTAEFPKNWYERAGFKPTGWIEYLNLIDDINLDNN